MSAVDNGDGTVTLSWTLPPSRYDRHEVVIRRAAGATAPTSVTGGTAVTSGSLISTYTDSPGAGTWSYAVFVGYDEDGDGDSDRYSAAATATVAASIAVGYGTYGNVVARWDASDTAQVTTSGGSVSSWTASEGTGDAVQADGDKQPVHTAGVQNGLHGVLYDGGDDQLSVASSPLSAKPFTVVFVAKVVDASVQSVLWSSVLGGGYDGKFDSVGGGRVTFSESGSGAFATASKAVNDGDVLFAAYAHAGSTQACWAGKTKGTAANATDPGFSEFILGQAGPAIYVLEAVLYDELLSDAEVEALADEFATKWSFTP